MAFVIRPYEERDEDTVVALALRAWEPVHASMAQVLGPRVAARVYPDWAASQTAAVREACTRPDVVTSLAVDGDLVLGFVCVVLRPAAGSGEIDLVAVDPRAQRRGTGRALVEHALARIGEAGCTLAEVATGGDPGHAPARALYRAAGFTPLPLVRYYRLTDAGARPDVMGLEAVRDTRSVAWTDPHGASVDWLP